MWSWSSADAVTKQVPLGATGSATALYKSDFYEEEVLEVKCLKSETSTPKAFDFMVLYITSTQQYSEEKCDSHQ